MQQDFDFSSAESLFESMREAGFDHFCFARIAARRFDAYQIACELMRVNMDPVDIISVLIEAIGYDRAAILQAMTEAGIDIDDAVDAISGCYDLASEPPRPIFSPTGTQEGFGSAWKRVTGLTEREKLEIQAGGLVVIKSRPAHGSVGTRWRVVRLKRCGKRIDYIPRVPDDLELYTINRASIDERWPV